MMANPSDEPFRESARQYSPLCLRLQAVLAPEPVAILTAQRWNHPGGVGDAAISGFYWKNDFALI